jgi:hypothetical protein
MLPSKSCVCGKGADPWGVLSLLVCYSGKGFYKSQQPSTHPIVFEYRISRKATVRDCRSFSLRS